MVPSPRPISASPDRVIRYCLRGAPCQSLKHPGGKALKFYSSVRIDLRRLETIKRGQDAIGNRVRAKVVKNKVAPPFRVAEFDIMFAHGISKEGDILDLGVKHEILRKSGAHFTFGETKLGQGRESAKSFLMENPDVALAIEKQVRSVAREAEPQLTAPPKAGEEAVAL